MNVTVYSTTTCATCHILTEWLDKHDVAYVKKNTDEDDQAMADFMAVNEGLVGVPFTVIEHDDGTLTRFPGYDVGKLQKILS